MGAPNTASISSPMNWSTRPPCARMAWSISVKYSLRSRTTSRGSVASTHGVKSRRSANSMVASMSWPSPRTRPARIASRISGVTYLPKVSFTISRSRSPCSMRLKPSATAPISSVLTTGARPSSRPRSTSAIAASTCRSGAATLLAAKIDEPDGGRDPDADQEDDGHAQAVDDLARGRRVGALEPEGAHVGQNAEDRGRHHADQQEDGEQPRPDRQVGDARHRAEVSLRKEEREAAAPGVLAGEEDERGGHRARDHGQAEDLAHRQRPRQVAHQERATRRPR